MNSDQPTNSNPYDFIINPSKPPKVSPLNNLPGSSNPLVMRLVMIIGGAVGLMILIAVAVSLLGGGQKINITDLVSLAQTQSEMVRISTTATTTATGQTAKNLAINVELSINTQQQQLLGFLAKHGRKVSVKELALKQNAATDQQFTAATQTSTFDDVYSKTIQSQLQAYSTSLKQLFNTATDDTERSMLSTDYTQAQLLLSQVPSSQALGNN